MTEPNSITTANLFRAYAQGEDAFCRLLVQLSEDDRVRFVRCLNRMEQSRARTSRKAPRAHRPSG